TPEPTATPGPPTPRLRDIAGRELFQTTRIYDRHGVLLYEIFEEGRRTWVPLEEIPLALRQATIATEDSTFYTNPGVDWRGILRALWQSLIYGRPISGGSTITQQLVRRLMFSPEERAERSLARKIKEIMLALALTRTHSKDEILEMYLNEIYYGHLAYGVEAAAQTYFNKHVSELNLAECALLAGLPQAPSRLDPFVNLEGAKARQRVVLRLMVENGFITPEKAEAAYAQPLKFVPPEHKMLAPHFVVYVRKLLEEKYGPERVARGGLSVITTLDLRYQRLAEEVARRHIAKLREEHGATNAALVAMQPATGEILAMLGSVDYHDASIDGQVNMALSERQPGSSIKPITYVTALQQGLTLAAVLWDIPTEIPLGDGRVYRPTNYDGRYHGPVRLRAALANSYNVPAVKLLRKVGVAEMLETAHRMGIRGLQRPPGYYGLSLTLGGGEVSLLDLTTAYATLANQGRYVAPVAILRVVDGQGRVLEEYEGPRPQPALDPRAAYLITDVLSDNEARTPAFGADSPLRLSRPAAAKTGTTSDWRDAWTVGYTPYLAVGVWVGNSDNRPMRELPGLRGAAPIWHDFMEAIFGDEALQEVLKVGGQPLPWEFPRPEGLEEAEICDLSSLDYGPECPRLVRELFIEGTVPEEGERGTVKLRVLPLPVEIAQAGPGSLPPRYCVVPEGVALSPGAAREVLFIAPPEDEEEAEKAREWAAEAGLPVVPAELCPPGWLTARVGEPSARWAITSPQPGQVVRGPTPVVGTASFRAEEIQFYKVEFGYGKRPREWITIGDIHREPVHEGQLELWHAEALPPGDYVLRLVLVKRDGNFLPPYEVPVRVE
ncbi:MAG TPA: PBP1A family penicillin-binding protein, partial [Anaerolineae bacterium]|nr:PBP1A family penicillin-binding protein [Anaerolineae bacterium]